MRCSRDLAKKKRDEQLKMVWRVSPAHKKLQQRMDQMRNFRRQHEQLRAVIVRWGQLYCAVFISIMLIIKFSRFF